MTGTTITAIFALLIGIINIVITIHINYFRKGILDFNIEYAFLNNASDGMAEFQIDLVFFAKDADIYIREVFLENDKGIQGNLYDLKNKLNFYRFSKKLNSRITDFSEKNIKSLAQNSNSFNDYKLEKGSVLSISLFDVVEQIICPDGRDDLPYSDYNLTVIYNDNKKITKNFSFPLGS